MEIKKRIKESLVRALEELGVDGGLGGEVSLEHPVEEAHGDYSTNVAMVAFSSQKGKAGRGKMETSPLALAENIAIKLSSNQAIKQLCDKVEATAPGFINFWLSEEALGRQLQEALKQKERYGGSEEGKGKRVLVDFSHPNIAKRFGVGHLRSTIIGQAIVNLYRCLGWEVIADNFLGDWGTQLGAMLAQVKSSKLKVQNLTIDDLERLYVEFNQKAKEDPKLWEEARAWFKKLEDGEGEAREIWQAARQVSLEEFKRIWDLLEVEFDYVHAESFFEDKIEPVIEDAQKAGIAKWDDGALIVPLEGFEAPLMLLKGDGATTYEARDLAAVKFWMRQFSPDLIVYEVGVDQDLHFRQFFRVAEMLGYAKKGQLVHVKHGLYRLETGKMRTRAGQTVKLELVLDEAINRARKLASTGPAARGGRVLPLGSPTAIPPANKHGAPSVGLPASRHPSPSFVEEVAQAVGIGAVKYFDLSHHPSTDIIFDWERIFALEGNGAPYVQYTHARCRSVLQKSKIQNPKSKNLSFDIGNLDLNAEELAILRYFYRFAEVVEEAASNFSPNLLCNFLFELAQRYNTFYSKHRILETQESRSKNQEAGGRRNSSFVIRDSTTLRLALTQVTANIFKTGLGLLGIGAPQKM